MSYRTLAAALVALAAVAVPADASSSPVTSGTWIPTAVTASFYPEAAAFPSGTGYVTTAASHDTDGIDPLSPARGFRTALLTTTDNGRTWSLHPDGLPAGEVGFSTETEWWAHSFPGGLERTTDAGATWNAVSLPLAAGEYGSGTPRLGAGGGGMAFATRLAPSTTSCPMHDALMFTGDGGATWERHDFPAYASGGGTVSSIDVASDDTAVAVLWNTVTGCLDTSSGTMDVYVTTDAGATWTAVITSPATGPRAVHAAISPDGSTILVGYSDGTVKWSTNGGTTFTTSVLRYPLLAPVPAFGGGGWDAVADVELVGSAGYVVLIGGSIHRTTDGGATWTLDGLHATNGVFFDATLAAFDADTAFTASPGLVATRIP